MVKDREARRTAVHGVAESDTTQQLNNSSNSPLPLYWSTFFQWESWLPWWVCREAHPLLGHSGSLVPLLLDLMVTLRPDLIFSSTTTCPFSVLLDWIQSLANKKMRHFSLASWFCIPFTKQIPSPYHYGKGNPSLCQLRYPFGSYLKTWPIFNLKKQVIFNQQFKCLNFKKGHNYEWEWRFYHSLNIPKSVSPWLLFFLLLTVLFAISVLITIFLEGQRSWNSNSYCD